MEKLFTWTVLIVVGGALGLFALWFIVRLIAVAIALVFFLAKMALIALVLYVIYLVLKAIFG